VNDEQDLIESDMEMEQITVTISIPKGDWCTTSMAWSRYPHCPYFDTNSKCCKVFKASLEYDYIGGNDPNIEGQRMLKCKECTETKRHGKYELIVENIYQYLFIFGSEGGATTAVFTNCLKELDPEKFAKLDD